jgi:hypothetical protein
MRNKFKFRTEQLAAKNRLDAQIKAAERQRQEAQKIQDELEAAAAAKDKAAALAAIKKQGQASYNPNIHGPTNYGQDSQGNQSFDFGGGFGIGSDGGPVSNRTGKGRTGYQAGGVATPEQYAAALAKVGGGTEADKRRSLGNYLGDYIATQGQKIGNAAIIPFQAAKGVLGIQGTPITPSMKSALQNIIQNQIKNTGKLSGNINYNDYGVNTTTGAEFEGFGNRSITDPESALATTLGRASYTVDPKTGKVNFTGGTAYDFRDDQFGGLGKFISKGGLFNQLPSPSNNFKPGATEYNPNISLSSDFLKPYQTTSSIPQFYQNNPGSYDFDKFKEAYAFATGQQNLVSRTPDGQIVTNFGNWDPSNTYGAYMSDTGTSNSNPFFSQFRDPNTFNKNTLISMYGAPGAGKAYYADGGLATMFSEKR